MGISHVIHSVMKGRRTTSSESSTQFPKSIQADQFHGYPEIDRITDSIASSRRSRRKRRRAFLMERYRVGKQGHRSTYMNLRKGSSACRTISRSSSRVFVTGTAVCRRESVNYVRWLNSESVCNPTLIFVPLFKSLFLSSLVTSMVNNAVYEHKNVHCLPCTGCIHSRTTLWHSYIRVANTRPEETPCVQST